MSDRKHIAAAFLGWAALALLASAPAALAQTPQQVTLIAKLRDFREFSPVAPLGTVSHPDFETMASCGDTGYVTPDLAVDRAADANFPMDNRGPVFSGKFNKSDGTPCFSNPSRFEDWYNDKDTATNRPFLMDLVFQRDAQGMYQYSNESFFPLDSVGGSYRKIRTTDPGPFGHLQPAPNDNHDFGFTMEFHATFTYVPDSNQTFTFSGDDDVWVFINGKRVIDLGGRHGKQTQTVRLNDEAARLGLTAYENYILDFFFAERHTTASNCIITTSLVFDKVMPPPSIKPGSTYFSGQITVTLTTPVPGGKLCYTLDGKDPDSATCSPVSGPVTINITETETVKVIALHEGWKKSDVASATFTKMVGLPAPVADPPGGTFEGAQTVTLTVPGVPDAVIHYTLDGSEPTDKSPVYSSPLTLDRTVTLKAKAFKAQSLPSPALTEIYTALVANEVTITLKDLLTTPPPLLANPPAAVTDNPFAAVGVDRSGAEECLNCAPATRDYYVGPGSASLPQWSIRTKYGFSYTFQIYDKLGEFVCKANGEITDDMLSSLRADGDDFRVVAFRWYPLSMKKAAVGTGAYILKAAISSHTIQNGQLMKSAEAVKLFTFGFLRPD